LVANTDHKKVILSRSLFPLIPRLILPPTPHENEICDVECYVSCIEALSVFELRKGSIWKNKAAVTVPVGWAKLADNLRDLIGDIAQVESGSESGALSGLRENAKVALGQLTRMLPVDLEEKQNQMSGSDV
jgi:hypothetical protein